MPAASASTAAIFASAASAERLPLRAGPLTVERELDLEEAERLAMEFRLEEADDARRPRASGQSTDPYSSVVRMIILLRSRSIGGSAGLLHHLRPFYVLVAHELVELLGRARRHLDPGIGVALHHLGAGYRLHQVGI